MRLTSQRQRSNYLRDFLKDRATLRSEANPRGLRDSKQSVMQYSLDATNGRCAYCGVKISHRNTNTGKWEKTGNDGDHLYPASKGAPFIEGQIVYSCKECNAKKNDLDPIEFLSYLHAINPPEKLFIEDLDEHVEFFMDRFIGHFIHNVPDQILVMMGSDSGVSDDDIDLIEAMDRDPSLMTFTPDVQSAFIARSLGHKKEVNRAHKELFMFSFAYDEELKKLAKSKGKSYRDQFYSSYTVFDWFSCIPGELGLDPNDVLNMDKIIEDHRDDTDSEMRIAGSVQDFMRPVMLSLRQRVAEAREDYEEKLQAWRDSGEVGAEPTDQSTTVYNRHCRSWNLLMKSFLTSDVVQGDPSKAELIRNSILPPTQAGLNQLLDLPSYVDPLQKLRFTASMILDDKKDMAYLKIAAGDNGEENVLDLSGWLPKNLPSIKGMYESRREQQSTVTGVKKRAKSHNLLSWSFKDDLFIRILLAGNDLVDENGNLNTQAFAIALFEKLREEVLIRNDNGMLKLPNSNSTNYSSVRTLFNSLDALSSIVLGWRIHRQIKESTMTKLIQDNAFLAKFLEDNNDFKIESFDLEVQSMDDETYFHFLDDLYESNYNNLSVSQLIAGAIRLWSELEEVEDIYENKISSLQEKLDRTSEELDEKNKELKIAQTQLDILWKVIEKNNIKLQNQ